MKKILYVHGLGSGINSSTLNDIKNMFDEYDVHGIEVNENPYESVKKIQDYINDNNIDILIGCSLGGFYGAYVDVPCKFLINPGFHIIRILKERIKFGTYDYFCEREDGKKQYTINQDVVDNFKYFMMSPYESVKSTNSYAIFSSSDDFIGSNIQLKNVEFANDFNFKLIISYQFGHRINNYILDKIKFILWNTEH